MDKTKQNIILALPVLYLVWTILMYLFGGAFSMSRSDPEYPYLLNGLACATLHFNHIGLISHPGTPFAIITGIFLSITHILVGQGSMVDDVLLRPELYLASASLYLTIITALIIYWIGRSATRNNGKITGAIILQSSFLLSGVLIDMSLRYSADRILAVYVLILAGITVNYLQSEKYSSRSYAIISGILMGVSLATKFNFLPVLVIPFLLIPEIRNRVFYVCAIAVSFFISVIPIFDKLKDFRSFISDIATHDGLYGQGSRHLFNWKTFGHNFIDLLASNPAYSIILILAIGLIIFSLLDRKKFSSADKLIQVLKAFVFASLIGFILVLKHYKIYYFIPVLSLSGLIFFVIWKISGTLIKTEKKHFISTIAVFTILAGITLIPLSRAYHSRVLQKEANLKTSRFYAENVTRNDLLFIEPTWEGGPMTENALVYGISYIAHREDFYQKFKQLYPNVITWEGAAVKPALFRTIAADPEAIVYGGKDIYVYSSPGRNANILLNYLDTLAASCGTNMSRDTVFVNPLNEDRVVRLRNNNRWSTLADLKPYTDPAELAPGKPVTQEIAVPGVRAGDYIEITVQILHNEAGANARCRIIARSAQSDQDGVYLEDSGSLQNIGDGWQLLRLRGKINATPADGKLNCLVYYPGNKKVAIQDLQIRHMGSR